MAQQGNTHQQGAVKDPEHDGRLKENRDAGVSKSSSGDNSDRHGGSHSSSSQNSGHTPGAVKDPEHDGRLKENRDAGVNKGTSR